MITLIGDIAFTGILSDKPQFNKERYAKLAKIINPDDLIFANLEVPVKDGEEKNDYKDFIHYSEYTPTKDLLKLLNIGCVSLANNHIYDCKMSGVRKTIELLDEMGIYHTGAGWKKEHTEPVITEHEGMKIGFIAYVDLRTNPKTENYPELYINYFNPEEVQKQILKLRPLVDKIICSIHWGEDYSFYPTQEQIRLAKEFTASGVDFIMGHHPHTLQPYEKNKESHIFYSLGGLTFGDYEKGGQLQALFRKTKNGLIAKYKAGENNFQFISTKELKGNYITITKRNFIKWSRRKWTVAKWKEKNALFNKSVRFNEKVVYRIYEYFFGYYKSPVKRLFQLSNLRKIKRLFNDFKRS